MEDNQRPFTPMIDRDPPTPEPIETGRKGHRAAAAAGGAAAATTVRTNSSNASGNEGASGQDGAGAANTSRSKDKSAKETAKPTGKGKATINRQATRAAVTTEASTDEKDPDNDGNPSPDGGQTAEVPRGESESSIRSPGSAIADFGYVPFQIEPDVGTIAVGASQVFKIKFAPLDVNEYQARLVCGSVLQKNQMSFKSKMNLTNVFLEFQTWK